MANIYDERSDEHAGFAAGAKIETTIDHHEAVSYTHLTLPTILLV